MKRLLTTLVILTGLIGSAGAVRADAQSDYDRGWEAYQAGDKVWALKWYRKAAEQGHVKALFSLGQMYRYGFGVTQDDAEALKWTRKGAEQGDASAQLILGIQYYQGKGVTQDDAEALKWLRKAAEQGHEDAKMMVGKMLER
jgi:TPR repeat protein